MKDKNTIDDIFRSGLENFETPPPTGNWSRIESELAKKKPGGKKNNRWGYYSIALIVLLISYTTYRIFNSDKSEIVKTNNTETISQNTAGTITSLAPEVYSGNSSAKNNNNLSKVNNINTLTADIRSTKPQNKISHEYNSAAAAEFPDKGAKSAFSSIKDEKEIKKTEDNFSEENNQLALAYKHETFSSASVPAASSVTGENNDIGYDVTNSTSNKNEETKNTENAFGKKEDLAATALVAATMENNSTQNNSIVNSSDNTPAGENTSNEQQISDKSLNKAPAESTVAPVTLTTESSGDAIETNQSVWKKIASNLFTEVFYSPDYVNSRLEVNNEYTGTASQDINDYNNQEAAFSYSMGLNVGYDIGSKWSVISGINYSTFSQTAVYNTVHVIEDSVYKKVHGHHNINQGGGSGGHGSGHGGGHGGGNGGGHQGNNPHSPPGNNGNHYVVHTPCGAVDLYKEPPHHTPGGQYNNGDTIQLKTETSELTEYLNIPIFVRYKFGTGKFSYFVEAGGAINLVRDNIVELTINDSYSETNEQDGLKNLNYSLSLGAGVQYNFYKGLSTFLRPSFRYSITPINQDNPINVYPVYFGLGFGLSIHF